jgi:Leucine-rich repeat (LRR) protein
MLGGTLGSRLGVTGSRLMDLAALKGLTTLNLRDTDVTDTCLKQLAALPALTNLDLSSSSQVSTRVTDAGLKDLARLQGLTTLNLAGHTTVTDAGLKQLAPLKRLTHLMVGQTRSAGVTSTGIADLKRALPNCNVERW